MDYHANWHRHVVLPKNKSNHLTSTTTLWLIVFDEISKKLMKFGTDTRAPLKMNCEVAHECNLITSSVLNLEASGVLGLNIRGDEAQTCNQMPCVIPP